MTGTVTILDIFCYLLVPYASSACFLLKIDFPSFSDFQLNSANGESLKETEE